MKNGFSLIETIIGIAAAGVLLAAFMPLLGRGASSLLHIESYVELQYETDFVMNMIVNDLRTAKKISIASKSLSVYPIDGGKSIIYEYQEKGTLRRMMKNSQPLTGETRLAALEVKSFSVKKIKDDLAYVSLTTENRRYKQSYTLQTYVHMANSGGEGG